MKVIDGFWLGYEETPATNLLNLVPSFVNTVTLFVAAPSPTSGVDTNYLCKAYSVAQQQSWLKQLQKQGQKVLMSFMDTPNTHWNQVDKEKFAQAVAGQVMSPSRWGVDGIDVDLESGMPSSGWAENFISLISHLRRGIGPSAILTADAYQTENPDEAEVLAKTKDMLSWVNTMGYFWDTESMKRAAKHYAGIMGSRDKVTIGVGVNYQGDQSTPLSEVIDLAQFVKLDGYRGMMLFPLNNDNTASPGDPATWGYCQAIHTNMGSQAEKAAE